MRMHEKQKNAQKDEVRFKMKNETHALKLPPDNRQKCHQNSKAQEIGMSKHENARKAKKCPQNSKAQEISMSKHKNA